MADIYNTVSKLSLDKLVKESAPNVEEKKPAGTSMTAAKIESIVNKLRYIEQWNGYAGIAKSEGVCKEWVKEVEAVVQIVISEKTPKVEEE